MPYVVPCHTEASLLLEKNVPQAKLRIEQGELF